MSGARIAGPRGPRLRVALLLVASVSILVFAGSGSRELVGDDRELIPDRTTVHQPWNVAAIFSSPYWGPEDSLYRPLTIWTLALNYGANELLGLPGTDAAGFHLVNVVLHALTACVLYLFLLQLPLPRPAPLVATLLFAVLPVHTEAVAMITGRSELLAAMLGLCFLILHRARGPAPVAAVCLLLALWSKESALAFLPLAVWTDACFPHSDRRWWPAAYTIHAATALVWVWTRSLALPESPTAVPFLDNPLVDASVPERLATAGGAQLAYLRLQLVPLGLSSDYSYAQIPTAGGLADPRFLGFATLTVAAGLAGWIWRRRHPVVAYAVLGYAMLFALTSNLLFPIGTILGERLAYAPSMMLCLLLAYAAVLAGRRQGRLALTVLAALLLLYGAVSFARNRAWSDQRTYVEEQVRSAPRSAKAHYNLGVLKLAEADSGGSIAAFEHALEIYPQYAEAWNWLGRAHDAAGEPAGATRAYGRAVELAPGYADAWSNLGATLARAGDLPDALRAFEQAVAADPDFAPYHFNLGVARQQLGDPAGAAEAYRTTLRLDPAFEPARLALE